MTLLNRPCSGAGRRFRSRLRSRSMIAVLTAAAFVVPASGLAQSPPSEEPRASKTDEARARYERGLKLYSDGAYDAARSEFERAYAIAPTYKVLYNIGLVHA